MPFDNFFVNMPFAISQNGEYYSQTNTVSENSYDYILDIDMLSSSLAINDLFDKRSFVQNSNNDNMVNIELEANLNTLNNMLYKFSSIDIRSLNNDVSGKNAYLTFEKGENKLLGFRLLEIVATKIFGHAKARSAISNDSEYYLPYSTETSLIKQIVSGINNGIVERKTDLFNQYVAYDRIQDNVDTNNASNEFNADSEATKLFNFADTEWEFPMNFTTSIQADSSILVNNGPNVGGSQLVNGTVTVPLLLRFFRSMPSSYVSVNSPTININNTTSVSNFSLNGATMYTAPGGSSTISLVESVNTPSGAAYASVQEINTYITLAPDGALFTKHVSFQVSITPGLTMGVYFKSSTDPSPVLIPNTNTSANDVYYTLNLTTGILTLYTKHFSELFVTKPEALAPKNIVLSGTYTSGEVTVYDTNNSTVFATHANDGLVATLEDFFIVNYDLSGTPLWTRKILGYSNGNVQHQIVKDNNGNLYVAMIYNKEVKIFNSDNSTVFATLTPPGTVSNGFILKYNSAGVPQWLQQINSSSGYVNITNLVFDSSDNLYVTGTYTLTGTLTFYNTNNSVYKQIPNTGTGSSTDTYIAKYNILGDPQWVRRIGGLGAETSYQINLVANNIYITLQFSSASVTIYNGDDSIYGQYTREGSSDMALIRYDLSGTPQSVSRIKDALYINVQTINDSNNLFIVCKCQNPCTAYNPNGSIFEVILEKTHLIIKYNSSGNPVWIQKLSHNDLVMNNIGIDGSGNIYVTATANAITVFNLSGTQFKTISPGTFGAHLFIFKYNSSGAPQWLTRISFPDPIYSLITSSGDMYIAGYSDSGTTFYRMDGTIWRQVSFCLYCIKYTTSGDPEYIIENQCLSGVSFDASVKSLSKDANNNIYISGSYNFPNVNDTLAIKNRSNVTFASLPITTPNVNDSFILKMNSDGYPSWVRRISGIGRDSITQTVIDNNSLTTIGTFTSSTLNIHNTNLSSAYLTLTHSLSVTSSANAFIVNYNPSGTILWSRRLGCTSTANILKTIIDSDGNLYACGTFYQTMNIYNANETLFAQYTTTTAVTDSDIFIIKYNSSGTPQWSRRIASILNDMSLTMHLDSSNNIYITGTYLANLKIYNADNTVFAEVPFNGTVGLFVAKYNLSGTPQWAQRILGSTVYPTTSRVDSSGNLYVSGYYIDNTFTIYNTTGSTFTQLTAQGNRDVFIVKYNTSGTPQWVRKIASSSLEHPVTLQLDSLNNLYVVGFYQGSLTMYNTDNSSIFATLTNAGSNDIFIAKYNSSGVPQWIAKIQGTGSDYPVSTVIDTNNNISILGYYSTSTTIYNSNGSTFITLTDPGDTSIFIAQYNSSGTPQWGRKIGGNGVEMSTLMNITTDNSIYVIGYWRNQPLIMYDTNNSSTFATLTNAGSNDIFIAKYNSTGAPQWIRKIASSTSDISVYSDVDKYDNIYVSGYYTTNTLTVYNADGSNFIQLTNNGLNDTFVIKYNSAGIPKWIRKVGGSGDEQGTYLTVL